MTNETALACDVQCTPTTITVTINRLEENKQKTNLHLRYEQHHNPPVWRTATDTAGCSWTSENKHTTSMGWSHVIVNTSVLLLRAHYKMYMSWTRRQYKNRPLWGYQGYKYPHARVCTLIRAESPPPSDISRYLSYTTQFGTQRLQQVLHCSHGSQRVLVEDPTSCHNPDSLKTAYNNCYAQDYMIVPVTGHVNTGCVLTQPPRPWIWVTAMTEQSQGPNPEKGWGNTLVLEHSHPKMVHRLHTFMHLFFFFFFNHWWHVITNN